MLLYGIRFADILKFETTYCKFKEERNDLNRLMNDDVCKMIAMLP